MWSFLTLPLNGNLICVASQHIIPTLRLFLKTFQNFLLGKNNFPWESHGKSEIPKTIISNITIRCIAYQLRLWIGFVYVFQTCISVIHYKSHKKGTLAPLKSSPSFSLKCTFLHFLKNLNDAKRYMVSNLKIFFKEMWFLKIFKFTKSVVI